MPRTGYFRGRRWHNIPLWFQCGWLVSHGFVSHSTMEDDRVLISQDHTAQTDGMFFPSSFSADVFFRLWTGCDLVDLLYRPQGSQHDRFLPLPVSPVPFPCPCRPPRCTPAQCTHGRYRGAPASSPLCGSSSGSNATQAASIPCPGV